MATDAIVETERLLMREFVEDDAEAFRRLNSDPEIMRYTGDTSIGDVEEARIVLRDHPIADYRKHGYGRWSCHLKATGEFVGFAGLKYLDDMREVDVGYRLFPAYWGDGLATEASKASIAYGFERLGLKRIIGLVIPENVASVRVLEKSGMTFEGMVDSQSLRVAQYAVTSAARR